MMGHAAVLFLKEVRVLMRDWRALVLLFGMPAMFILFLSLALKEVYAEKGGRALTIAIALEDSGEAGRRVAHAIAASPEFRVGSPLGAAPAHGKSGVGGVGGVAGVAVGAAGVEAARAAFDRGEARAMVVIPEGFSEDLEDFAFTAGDEPFGPHRVVWAVDPVLDATYRWFLQATIALAVQQAILDSLAGPGDDGAEDVPVRPRRPADFSIEAPRREGSLVLPTPLQQTVPGWSLFAMFFIAVPLSASFLRDRTDGTLERVMAYPVSPVSVVAGKCLPYLCVNILQFCAMLLVGLYVVPLFGDLSLQLGSRPLLLVPVTLVAAFAATSYGILVASLTRSAEQAGTLGATSVILMAVTGGVMVPSFAMPQFMQTLGLLSPVYWGHQAYLDVLLREASLSTVAPRLAALLAFAAVCLVLATFRLRGLRPA